MKSAAAPHPLTRLVAVAIASTAILYAVFFHFSERIWALRADIPVSDITPWARWGMADRDGAEPQFLLLLVLVVLMTTGFAMWALERIPRNLCGTAVAACFGIGLFFMTQAPPLPPFMWPASNVVGFFGAEVGVLATAALAWQLTAHRLGQILLALFLVPVCFLPASLPRWDDLSTVLAPALKLRHGAALSQIYFQYDYFPSLVALGWEKLGFDPASFPHCTAGFFYLLLAGCFLVAFRMFDEKRMAGVLLVALIVVRIYAIRDDANAAPQVTPVRLDLWIYLLGLALAFGLRHWSVGLAAGLMFCFSRSVGMLYLGGYGLALVADFFARWDSANPFAAEARTALRETRATLALLTAGVVAGFLLLGGLVPEAVALYRRVGLSMMRISSYSSYWWILPFLAMAGWLAFSRYRKDDKRSAAALFAVALAISNSIYFFGRSHEHNLLNISASLLFCVFWCLDRMRAEAARAEGDGPWWLQKVAPVAPWLFVGILALAYSGALVTKTQVQWATVAHHAPLPEPESTGPINCAEMGGGKVFVYSAFGYWFDERCGFNPQGYVQPFWLHLMKKAAVDQLDGLLNSGYKIVVPKAKHWNTVPGQYTYNQFEFGEMEAALKGMEHSETPNYTIYWRSQQGSVAGTR